MAKVFDFRQKWNAAAVAKARADGKYAKYPTGTAVVIGGSVNKWKPTGKDSDPSFTYSTTQRVAGPYAALQAAVQRGELAQDTLVNAYTRESAGPGGPLQAMYEQELAAHRAKPKAAAKAPLFTLSDVPGILAASKNKDNWVTKDKKKGKKGKGAAAGPRKANIVPLSKKLRDLAPGKILNVSGLKDTGAGARTITQSDKMRLKYVPGLQIASSKPETYALALNLLVAENAITEAQARQFNAAYGGAAAAAPISAVSSAASSPGVVGIVGSPGSSPLRM